MRDQRPAPASEQPKLPSGVDRSQLRASLRLSPRERLDRAVQAARAVAWLRRGKRVRPSSGR